MHSLPISLAVQHLLVPAAAPRLPEDVPGEEDVLPGGQRVARHAGSLYFIDERGLVFRRDLATGRVEWLEASSAGGRRVVALAVHAHRLVALNDLGRIDLWSASLRGWVFLGSNASSIVVCEGRLYAATRDRQLWVYRGAPSPSGLGVAFDDTGARGVTGFSIAVGSGEVLAHLADARRQPAPLRLLYA